MTYRDDALTPGPAQRAALSTRARVRRTRALAGAALLAVELAATLVGVIAWAAAEVSAARHGASAEVASGDSLALVGLLAGGAGLLLGRRAFAAQLPRRVTLAMVAAWLAALATLGLVTLYALAVR